MPDLASLLHELADRGEPRGATEVLRRAAAELPSAPGRASWRGRPALVLATAAAVVAGAVLVVSLDDGGTDLRTTAPSTSDVVPPTSEVTPSSTVPPDTERCVPVDGSEPMVDIHVVTAVPDGFVPEGPVERSETGPGLDMGGESRSTLRFVSSDGRWIDVVSFGSYNPRTFVEEAHDGAESTTVTFERCFDTAEGPAPTTWQAELSVTDTRSVLGAQEWEYGGFLVVGGPGVSAEDLIEVASGLRLQ